MICLSYKTRIVSLGDHSLVNIRARQVSPRACDKNRFIVTANPECCIKSVIIKQTDPHYNRRSNICHFAYSELTPASESPMRSREPKS